MLTHKADLQCRAPIKTPRCADALNPALAKGMARSIFAQTCEAPLMPKRGRVLGSRWGGRARTKRGRQHEQTAVAALCVCLNDLINATKLCGG
jgi:hypothetical protein